MAAGLLAFLIALFASVMLVVPVRALALRVGMVDLPGPRKVHLKPIPLLGGLAMYGAVVIAVLSAFHGPARAQVVGILIGATLMAGVGILDDRGVLHHQVKLFVGMPLAAGLLMVSGIRAQVFSVLLGGPSGDYLDVALTVVWVVGITASFSILRDAGILEWPDIGHDIGGCGSWSGHRISSLEFQAGKNLHG
jgi:UDP-GlcNAc:undecaprenyl-phosphate GlcNAc-1-phosphate transferase